MLKISDRILLEYLTTSEASGRAPDISLGSIIYARETIIERRENIRGEGEREI